MTSCKGLNKGLGIVDIEGVDEVAASWLMATEFCGRTELVLSRMRIPIRLGTTNSAAQRAKFEYSPVPLEKCISQSS
jgi:hypothetical protein